MIPTKVPRPIMTYKPYSESCDQNKDPILALLQKEFAHARRVLEIGSGTGQHAVYFGRHLPHLTWQTSDVAIYHEGIRAWLDEAMLPNVLPPLALDVDDDPWPAAQIDAVFSANTAHIMSWPQVERLFAGIGHILQENGVFCLYGPFNYGGTYTSPSNARFDMWLKARDPLSGIRDFESLDELARTAGMSLLQDYAMPANNRTLVWRKA